uniref:C-type lectin domain-containing protein n=1 Tax=Branchiostoma floridae TaxID=7739 RepID=C3ZYF5_BRAFL|eukprot:XP_002586418.1 hypothetical protein BRAFLDRAFT_107697 [Branchiostoma floridae]
MPGGQQQSQTGDTGTTPMQQPQTDWQARADAAASIPNPMYASREGAPMQQPQTDWKARADAAASIPNPMYVSGEGAPMQRLQTDWRSIADTAARTPNPMYGSETDRTCPGGASSYGALQPNQAVEHMYKMVPSNYLPTSDATNPVYGQNLEGQGTDPYTDLRPNSTEPYAVRYLNENADNDHSLSQEIGDAGTSGNNASTFGAPGNDSDTSQNDTATSGNESQNDAVTSWNDADISGNDASTSGNDAGFSRNNAVTPGNDADTSVNDAVISGNDADTSVNDAVISRNDADTSVNDAVVSGNDAATSQNDDDIYENDAGIYENDASASGTDAVTRGNDPVTSGNDACTSGSPRDYRNMCSTRKAKHRQYVPNSPQEKAGDRAYPDGTSGISALCSSICNRQRYMAAGIVVILSLVALGLAPLTFINQQEIYHLSTIVDALKHNQCDMHQLSTAVDALKCDQDNISTTVEALTRDQDDMSTTADALKRDQDDKSTTADALKRDQDDISTTANALTRDQDDIRQLSTTVDALKRDQYSISTTVDVLKRDQYNTSTTVGALKRDLDDIRQLSTTVDALKRDQYNASTTVGALKCDLDDIRQLSTTVDALKRDLDNIRQLSPTVDALKRDLNKERNRRAALEQRLHEISNTQATCPKGYIMSWQGICYKAYDIDKSFSDAAMTCRDDGATIAMPKDAETNDFMHLMQNTVAASTRSFWIGLHDQRADGSFEWVDGSALKTYNAWGAREPRNWGDRYCVLYSSFTGSGKGEWMTAHCYQISYRFICQTDPGTSYNYHTSKNPSL